MASTTPMTPADVQATFAATLVDEWIRAGVAHAVICPGSRSTPLALALTDRPGELRVDVHHDERSAAFLALGIGLQTGRPAIVLTTSGTAAVELHPAIVEADLAGVPLIACTADRPPELRDVGAPQAIDQIHLYGRSARWFADPGVPDAASTPRWRALAARAVAEATGGHPGPVHLNLPFREPLVGTAGELPPGRGTAAWTRQATGARPGVGALGGDGDVLASLVDPQRRGVIVAGASPVTGAAVHRLAAALGWPVLADPRSAAWHQGPTTIGHLDGVLRSPAAASLRPEVIVRIGPPGASRVVNEWLAASGADEVVLGVPHWSDPAATASVVVTGDPAHVVAGLVETAAGRPRPDDAWLARWQTAGVAAADAVDKALAQTEGTNEPAVARDVVAALPEGSTLVVSSSMPIRDVERYATPRGGVRVLANRGANGIDGVVSTALGAAVGSRAATGLLIGDVAFLHDTNGLLGAAARGVDLVCVVVDNDGGGIFSFLPQSRTLPGDRFESLFGTPHGLDLVAVAASYGVTARAVEGAAIGDAVRTAARVGGVHVLVARTDRDANTVVHEVIDNAVAAAVGRALGG